MNRSIMIMCEQQVGRILPVTYELMSCAAQIAKQNQAMTTAVLPGSVTHADPMPGADLLIINSSALTEYTCEGWEQAALLAYERIKPDIIIVAHTSTGYDYAPRIAARLEGCCVTSVNGIEMAGDRIVCRRSGFHGKLDLLYGQGRLPLVITALPGAFPVYAEQAEPGSVNYIDASIDLKHTSDLVLTIPDQTNMELEHAEVIVAAGKGIGKAENLQLIRDLASCFNRSAIAGSRVACDNGWIEYNAQVGLTGKKVAPPLYIACGISGSMQHIAGMKDSKTVVSINRDPEAAIFKHSDICIVDELEKFIPAFISVLRGRSF